MTIHMPENVYRIIKKLEENGYKAYAVGGCIRDSLMGIEPQDWDITTSAQPDETLKALGSRNIIDSGLKHGTVTVMLDGRLYEITTFRTESTYSDGRRPDKVSFVTNIRDDLSRRDFTINAIAYNPDEGICDLFGGEEDILNKIIRCVGDPDKRFEEDALRIMRALRFASRLGFSIDEKTSESIHNNAKLLKRISQERKSSELLKLLDGEYADKILVEYYDVIAEVIPEITPTVGFIQNNPHHIYDVWEHTSKVVINSPHSDVMRLAALLHDIGKPKCYSVDQNGIGHFHGHPKVSADMTRKILRRLRIDNKKINDVLILIENHDKRPPLNPKNVRRFIAKVGVGLFESLLQLKYADSVAQNPELLPQKLEYIDELRKMFVDFTADGEQFNIRSLKINGSDLIEIGFKEGKQLGAVLNHLLSAVVDGELKNEHDELISAAEKYLKNQ